MAMPFGENPSEFALEDVQLYVGTLPEFLLRRLQMNQKGLADDYVNFPAVGSFACAIAQQNPAFGADRLEKKLQSMIDYRAFLLVRVREHNQLCIEASLRVDEALFVETMMSVPLVAEVDAKVAEAKSLWQKQDVELPEKIAGVKKLLDEAVALFR